MTNRPYVTNNKNRLHASTGLEMPVSMTKVKIR